MKETKLLTAILFSAYFATLECNLNFAPPYYGIRKFLKTPVPIWTFNTTKGKVAKARCEVDLLLTISKTHIIYHHLFYEKLQKRNIRMLGTFDPRNKDRIFVQAKGSVYNITHEMLYLNWRYKCAVFKVTTPCYGMCSWHEFSAMEPSEVTSEHDPLLPNESCVASMARPPRRLGKNKSGHILNSDSRNMIFHCYTYWRNREHEHSVESTSKFVFRRRARCQRKDCVQGKGGS
ncbi:hypothetical protein MTO96_045927 [Rhipicephalus appendiculatus]